MFMKKLPFLILLTALGCKSVPIGSIPSNIASTTNDWTLVSTPNSLDDVGTIFAIDRTQQTYIPVKLRVPLESGTVQIPSRKLDKSVNIGFLLGFLGATSFGISDTSHIVSSFDVSQAVLYRPTKSLAGPFEENHADIIKELNFRSLSNSRVYLVTEIIKAKKVDISYSREGEVGGNLANLITKYVDIKNAGVKFQNKDSTLLSYSLNDSLTIFYKLSRIELKKLKFRDPLKKDSIVSVTISNSYDQLDDVPPYQHQ